MKKKIAYDVNGKTVTREISYIPVRYVFAFLLVVLEILAIIGIVVACCYYIPFFYLAALVTQVACVLHLVSSDNNPDYKVPWLLCLMLLPIAGFMLYFLFYSRKLKKKYIHRLRALSEIRVPYDDTETMRALAETDKRVAANVKLLCESADTHLYRNTKLSYFALGEEMHKQLLEDLASAKRFIFVEYFIIEEGVFWNSILEILKEKAANGVVVRVLYDDIGCMCTLPGNYAKKLRAFGIEASPFSRMRGSADSEFNNRNHRKILVIDGKIAYTGGINLADEYINHVARFGHWKDTGIRMEGAAVCECTRLFLLDYGINVPKEEVPTSVSAELYPVVPAQDFDGYIVPFGDGPRPIYQHNIGKNVLLFMLALATESVYMTTPYFICDHELCAAIENAALRGVDVRLIVPHIPDKKLIFEITKSYYSRLLQAGVRVYEYTPGFIHAKSYIADGKFAMIGSINLDYRSLVHHFENGVFLCHAPVIADMVSDFLHTEAKSQEIRLELCKKTKWYIRLLRAVLRVFAPML